MSPPILKKLVNSGLLFEVNRQVLHPHGMALAVVYDDPPPAGEPVRLDLLATDDDEGFVFDEESLRDGSEKLARYMASNGAARMSSRIAALGTVQQGAGRHEAPASPDTNTPTPNSETAAKPTTPP